MRTKKPGACSRTTMYVLDFASLILVAVILALINLILVCAAIHDVGSLAYSAWDL